LMLSIVHAPLCCCCWLHTHHTRCCCWLCAHTQELLVIVGSVHRKLIDWVCALFVVDCETLLMIVFPKKKKQNLLLCMWSRFYRYCTYPDSLASYYIYICVCV
jgi:hypothetical protein